MSDESTIQAESRTEFGKGAARRIRRDHKVPAVLYGHGAEPVHITLPGHETMMALKHGGANALLTIVVDGNSQMALPKQVQRDPIKGFLEHLDLIIVKKGEKVTVEVPVVITGEAGPDTLVAVDQNTITVEALATAIPESIEVSVEGAEAGTQILAKDLQVPSGSTVQLEDDVLIVNITAAPTTEEIEAELAEAEAEVGIEHDAPEGEEGSGDETPAEDDASE